MKKKIVSILLATCLLMSFLLIFSSCYSEVAAHIVNAEVNENGELILSYSNGTAQNVGNVVGSDGAAGADGGVSTVIVSEDESIPYACSKGLRSTVSITCRFEVTVQQGGFRPSYITQEYVSGGSGVIYKLDKESGDAFIITNHHVVYNVSSNSENGISEDISVYLYGSENENQAIKAEYVGGSLYYDIAVLSVKNSDILKNSDACEVTVADSDKASVGESAIAIGNARGYGIAASLGIVSVDSEYITMTGADEKTTVTFRALRVDAAINSGNSGGGLFNSKGELIGVVNVRVVSNNAENIGYAIPSNIAVSVADNILDYCYGTDAERIQKAVHGIELTAGTSRAVYDPETGKVSIIETLSVSQIAEGSLSDGILEMGDVLQSATLNGDTLLLTREYQINDLMLRVRVGDTVSLTILRDGEEMTVQITVTEDSLIEY